MMHRLVGRRHLILILTFFGLVGTPVTWLSAQEEPPAEDGIGLNFGGPSDDEDEDRGKKKVRSRRPTVRDGSWLHKDEPIPEVVEVRSRYEAFLDAELRKHFARLAVLDRIQELAEHSDDERLAGRVDAVRRKELQRYRRVMTEFRLQAQARRVAGF